MSKKSDSRRKLRFEGLEQRTLLAVTAAMSGTELRVIGDNNPNDVDITQIDADSYLVASEEGPEGSFDGVTSIRVELKGSGDVLDIFGNGSGPLAGNLIIKMGLGDDSVNPTPPIGLDVTGNVTIETSDGVDSARIPEFSNIGGSLTINMGHDGDSALIAGTGAVPLTVGGNVTIKMGEGDDGDVTVTPNPKAGLNIGDINVTGTTLIETSDGNDVVYVGGISNFNGGLEVNMGHGNDFLRVGNNVDALTIGGLLELNTGEGNDRLIVQLQNAGPGPTTEIRTSDGEDTVTVQNSRFASLDVNTGLDDDLLTFLANVVVAGNASLNGSGGFDTLDKTGLSVSGTLTEDNWELVTP